MKGARISVLLLEACVEKRLTRLTCRAAHFSLIKPLSLAGRISSGLQVHLEAALTQVRVCVRACVCVRLVFICKTKSGSLECKWLGEAFISSAVVECL